MFFERGFSNVADYGPKCYRLGDRMEISQMQDPMQLIVTLKNLALLKWW